MKRSDGGPAFPLGMSLRDYFAAAAVQGLLAQTPTARSAAEFAAEAYVCADAMLAERVKP